jgi:hypothetical protein
LLPPALSWLAAARATLPDEAGVLASSFLTSVFSLVVGVERLFPLDEMEDVGFALLCGDRWPSRFTVGGWRRHLGWQAVDAFCRRTSPWPLLHDTTALVSYDEHTIPRWTHKFRIPKGYVTTRNKHLRCAKLSYTYDLASQRYLAVRATPGNVGLIDVAVPLVQQTLTRGQPAYLHALFDAGAGKRDAGVRALWQLAAAEYPRLDVTVRACRYPHRMRAWKQLPRGLFVAAEEAGRYVGAPAKEIRLAETATVLRGESAEQGVRTVICREIVPGPKHDRWHALFTTTGVTPLDVLTMFRARQHHEQAYRVGVYDEALDAVPCGYDKESPDPQRSRFHRGPLQLIGWLVALVYNAVADLTEALGEEWAGSHVRTIRRTFLNRPGMVYGTPTALVVQFDPFAGQEALTPVIDRFNAENHRIPWLANRRVVVSLTPRGRNGPSRLIINN